MFQVIRFIFMILLINNSIICQSIDESNTNPPINFTDIDTGTLLSDIFTLNTVAECSGTCIHAITSLFCDDIDETVSCHYKHLRCCRAFNNVTVVETSSPIEEAAAVTTLSSTDNSFDKHSSSSYASSSTVHNSQSTKSLPNVTNQSSSTTNLYSSSVPTVITTNAPAFSAITSGMSTTHTPTRLFTSSIVQRTTVHCSGICMDSKLSKYCGNILANEEACDKDQFCCLQSNRTIITTTVHSSSSTEPTTITDKIDINNSNSFATTDTTTVQSSIVTEFSNSSTSTTETDLNQTSQGGTSEQKIVIDESYKNATNGTVNGSENENKHNKNSDESNQVQDNDKPPCEAECVVFIFGFLCDEIDNTKRCSGGSKCCINYDTKNDSKDDSKNNQLNNQVTTVNPNQMVKCPGTCIPSILSGICTKPSEIIFKSSLCLSSMICCYTPMNDQYNITHSNDKPSLLENTDDLTFIEPSEQTLNTKLTQFNKPPTQSINSNRYYQLVPKPHQLIPANQFATTLHQSNSPPNPLISSPNWPFLNNNHHYLQKIPIYKTLLSNSQMIPNSYLSNNGLATALSNSLNNGRPNFILNNLNNNYNTNRSPALFYPAMSSSTSSGTHSANDLFSNLASNYLSNNNALPTVSPFKLNSTSSIISHILLTNNIPPAPCTGTCMQSLFKFTCLGSNTIYANFICNKPQQVCCASNQDIMTYETGILASLGGNGSNNETSLLNSLILNNYFANILPASSNNIPPSSINSVSSSISNKPVHNIMNTMINGNVPISSNKIKTNNKNFNTIKPQSIDRSTNKDINSLFNDKFIEINQPAVSAASNINRNRYQHQATSSGSNKNSFKLTPIDNKWSSSLSHSSNLSSNHFKPSEKPFNPKVSIINERIKKKPDQFSSSFTPIVEQHKPMVEVPSVVNKLPICGVPNVASSTEQNLKWCWQVALLNQDNQYICSGALMSTNWVLVPANCISKMVQNAEPIFVRVGESDLMAVSTLDLDTHIQKANTTYIHHNHNGETLENDIALIKLQRPLQLKSNICSICLPARGSIVESGKRCTVTSYSPEASLKIRESSVSILTDYQCTKQLNSVENRSFMLPTSSFCAGNGDEICDDSDGPLACLDEDGYYELIGLVSYNFDCKMPAIYVKVSNFIGWINQIISVNN